MSGAYYNDTDPYVCDWLENLIRAGLIAPGDVDRRSIVDVRPDDLRGYTQCHFFAGIGGWSLACRLAGVPDDWPLWTGSCPCQDFALLGKRAGFNGDRDLWPEWFRLIRECRPDRLFSEQVDDAPEWLDRAAADLETIDYACGSAVIPAVAVGAPHERLRLYFAAHANKAGRAHAEGLTAAEAQANVGSTTRMVHSHAPQHFRWPAEPDKDWIVDGLSGEGLAVGAFGNAIVVPLAAQFIRAYLDIERDAGTEGCPR